MSGRFITLEGGEGVGKSTQAARLAAALRDRGLEVVVTREPGGSTGAEAIRALLLDGPADRWGARAEALMFAAARADHVDRTIRPATAAGTWVLCDRFVDSSRAYQGAASGLSDDDLLTIHAIGSDGLLPDRTLVLALPDDAAMARAENRDGGGVDRIGGRGPDYHRRVAAAFRSMAAASPNRFRVIDGSGEPATVTGRLLDALGDLLP